jgi:hypothetical protein
LPSDRASKPSHLVILLRLLLPDQAADVELGDELEPPTSDDDVVSVAAVGIVVIEDGFDRFGLRERPGVADVEPLVGVGGEEVCALASKGSITASA